MGPHGHLRLRMRIAALIGAGANEHYTYFSTCAHKRTLTARTSKLERKRIRAATDLRSIVLRVRVNLRLFLYTAC